MPSPDIRRVTGCYAVLFYVAFVSVSGCRDRADTSSRKSVNVDRDISEAVQASRAGNFGRVEELLRPVLLVDPTHGKALYLLGQAQAAKGDIAGAVSTVSAIPPDDSEAALAALGQSADWLIELGRFDEAERRLRQLISKIGDAPQAHRRLAQLLNNQGYRIKAAPHMRTLARLGQATESELYGMTTFSDPFLHRSGMPGFGDINLSELCQVRGLWYDRKVQEAYLRTDKLRKEHPDSTAVSAFYGRIIVYRQDDSGFVQWLASTPPGIEQEPAYWAAIGNWYQRQGQHDVAIRCFAEAVLRDDTDRFSYLALARSLYIQGRTDDATRVMQRYRWLDDVEAIASDKKRTPEQFRRIVQRLLQLRRPFEARAWSHLARQSRAAVGRHDFQEPADEDAWITCGITPSNWPLPNFSELGVREPAHAVSANEPGGPIVLINVAKRTGLDMLYLPGPPGTDLNQLLMHQTIGGGIATIDFDLDGWADLYFTQSAGPAFKSSGAEPNQLFRNLGGEQLIKVASRAGVDDRGYGQGATTADINQDGFADLIVANVGANVLYINNGDGTFSERDLNASGNQNLWTTSIACGDLTGDHLPDIVEVNYIDDPNVLGAKCSVEGGGVMCNPHRYRAATDRILRNAADGTLAPLQTTDPISPGYGLAAVIANVDNRFGNDLFITNDTSPNDFWQSQGDENAGGPFELVQRAELLGCANGLLGIPESCMGIATGDFDRNGLMDLHVTNYTDESSDLYLQHASGVFSNDFIRFGLESATIPMVGWGTQASDLNCDGWLELIVLNGHLYSALADGTPYRMLPQIFRGGETGFQLATSESDQEPFWKTAALGRTLATVDWNADGKTDIVAYNMDTPVALLENQSTVGNWLQLELIGTASERDAVGAKVDVVCPDSTWTAWVTGGDGYQCKNESVIHVGIGTETAVHRVDVTWPSGRSQSFRNVVPNQRYLVVEAQTQMFAR